MASGAGRQAPAPAPPLAETAASIEAPGATDDTVIRVGPSPVPVGGEPSSVEERPGQRIGRYFVLSKLGQGGMGEVFSGYDEELDRRVALKVVRQRLAGSRGQERMLREAQALGRLSHPNVVQIHDVGEFDGELFLAMEFVKGVTLRAWQARHDPASEVHRSALIDMYMQAGRGLAAAHAAGIVHRDFKPDNVIVGDDGRARVLDFGLATDEPRAAESAGRGVDLDGLTDAGSILGTPAYMAPEQFMARPTDARTDVFAFSVALYDALYGEMPFEGTTLAGREAAVLAGQVRTAPVDSKVPAWLRAVLLRGLARDPADRFGSMEAMLVALADDPIARRRRYLRLGALGVVALVLSSLVVAAIQAGWRRLERRRVESAASERLDAAWARIDAGVAAGEIEEADRVFHGFVAQEDNRGTAALGEAWLRWAGEARRRGLPPVDALATAYAVASSSEVQEAALVELAALLRDEMRWQGLARALATLDERGGGAAESADLRLDAAIGRHDLAGAAELLRGPLAGTARAEGLAVVEALRPATRTRLRVRGSAAIADFDGDGRDEVLLVENVRERQSAPILRADLDLAEIGRIDVDGAALRPIPRGAGRPALVVTTQPSSQATTGTGLAYAAAVVLGVEGGRGVERFRWPEGQIIAALSADVDGDGEREILIGAGPYTRRVVELEGDESSGFHVRPAIMPAVDERRSDVVELLAHDLDGDGRVEVVAALGAWVAYELAVLRHDPEQGSFGRVARRRLGFVSGAAIVDDREGGVEIVATKSDEYPSAVVFPRDRPFGDPAGTYFLRFAAERLEVSAFVPAPRFSDGTRVSDKRPLVADLDGDGRHEVVFGRVIADPGSSVERDQTVVLVRGGGVITPLVLGDLFPVAALDLDGDGDDELLVSSSDPDDDDRLWILGAGAGSLPAIPPSPAPAHDLPIDDPALVRMFRRGDDLVRMGLVRQGAESLAATADLVGDPEVRADVQLAAAELFESLGDDARAGTLFDRAVASPRAAARARAGAARSLLRRGEVDGAREHLAAAGRLDAATLAVAATLQGIVDGGASDLDFRLELADYWRIRQPLALHRDGARGLLDVEAFVPGEILEAPLRWGGGGLVLEVEVDLRRVEWRSGLEIGLVGEGATLVDGRSPLGVDVTASGGARDHVHEIACMSHGRRTVARIPFLREDPGDRLGTFVIRTILLPDRGEWICEVARGTGEILIHERAPITATLGGRPLRLVIAASRGPVARADASIRRIRVQGARVDPSGASAATEAPDDRALRRFVEADMRGVLDALASAQGELGADLRLLEVAALAYLGRGDEAALRLAPLLTDASARAHVLALLRRDPWVFGALVRAAAGPAAQRVWVTDAWSMLLVTENEPRACEVVATALAEREVASDRFEVLRAHALATECIGDHRGARASFLATIRAIDERRGELALLDASALAADRSTAILHLAAVEVASGDVEAARAVLGPLIHGPGADTATIDRVRAREDLAVFWPELDE